MNGLKNTKTPPLELWKLASGLKEDMRTKESAFLIGIEENGKQIYESCKIRKMVAKFYSKKFSDEISMENNLQTIKMMHREFRLSEHFHEIIEDISKEMEEFPINTTYGPDLILPSHLKSEIFRTELKILIDKILTKNEGEIPETALAGRLILLSKTGAPIAELDKTRPIIVQNLMIRLIEKVIKTKLEN